MKNHRGQAAIVLAAAAALVIVIAGAIFFLSSNPNAVNGLTGAAGGNQSQATPTAGASPSPIETGQPTPAASPNATAQPEVNGTSPTPTLAPTPRPTPGLEYFIIDPTLRCYSSIDCYKSNGNCTSRLAPERPGILACQDCVCICLSQVCQNQYYVERNNTLNPTPVPTPTPAPPINATWPTATPTASPTPTPTPPYQGKGAILVTSGKPGIDIYMDGVFKARLPGNEVRYTIFGVEPGAHKLAVAGFSCSGNYDVTVTAESMASVSVCPDLTPTPTPTPTPPPTPTPTPAPTPIPP